MPICKNNGRSWESTLLLDIFNNEIIVHQATPFQGRTKPYYHCLEQLKPLASKKNETDSIRRGKENDKLVCKNPHCITGVERGIKQLFDGGKCIYCDQIAAEK